MKPEPITIMQNYDWAVQPIPLPWWTWPVLISLVLCLGTAAAFWFWRRKQTVQIPSKPLIPAHITALEALRRLEELLTEEKRMEFIVQISLILRIYIQDRFKMRAPHRSTEEFLWEASESTLLSYEDQQRLADFMGLCDRIKFARRDVILDEMKSLLNTARRFVEETAERPTLAVKGAAA